jgi:hypothetical protein
MKPNALKEILLSFTDEQAARVCNWRKNPILQSALAQDSAIPLNEFQSNELTLFTADLQHLADHAVRSGQFNACLSQYHRVFGFDVKHIGNELVFTDTPMKRFAVPVNITPEQLQ